MTIFHCCAVRTDSEVYCPSVQVPLVSVWVIRGCRAAVIPQPHVVKMHRCPPIVERWGLHMKGLTVILWWTNTQRITRMALDSLRQSSCKWKVADVAAQARVCISCVHGVFVFLTPHSSSAGRTFLLSAPSILGINTIVANTINYQFRFCSVSALEKPPCRKGPPRPKNCVPRFKWSLHISCRILSMQFKYEINY